MTGPSPAWVCCQLGAREHYVIPRGLHRCGRLWRLITDAWVRPNSLLKLLPGVQAQRLGERYHPDLAHADVRDFTTSLLTHEIAWRATSRSGWDLFTRRNQWFQQRAVAALRGSHSASRPIVFAHSYAAHDIFQWAKTEGWFLVLGQIDPGEEHFRIVTESAVAADGYGPPPAPPPAEYLAHWRKECQLADRIVVNSEWSRQCLERAGVAGAKIAVVPLAYEPQDDGGGVVADRRYPEQFSAARPLRVLFVGQVAIAKGARALLEATDLLTDIPFELTMAGGMAMQVPRKYLVHPSVRWVGHVPRGEVMRRYQDADVLIFPSLSDGFGMAQVEAQGWRLPIVASRYCGQVVRDTVNGMLLPEVTPQAIAAAIRALAASPAQLADFQRHSGPQPATSVAALGDVLASIEPS